MYLDMYEAAVDVGVELVATYGLAALLAVFILEGALVGKLIPTRTLFVATVLLIGSDAFSLASVAAVAVIGATLGQLVLFGMVRRTDITVESLPGVSVPSEADRLTGWLDRWGMAAVVLSNALPVTRGSLTAPAAMSDGNALRFMTSSLVGSSVYASGLVAVAAGMDTIIGIV